MCNIYDKIEYIIFDDGKDRFVFQYSPDIQDCEDYLIIETQIEIGDIGRGWVGDIRIRLSGIDIVELNNPQQRVETEVEYKDVLCCRRIFDIDYERVATWKYTFNKY